MVMKNYKSKTLNRTFDLVYFAEAITPKGKQALNVPAHPPHEGSLGSGMRKL
jgi:hypothetical protein